MSATAPPTTVVFVPSGDGLYYYRRSADDWDAATITFIVFIGVFACLLLSCLAGDYAVGARERKRDGKGRYADEC